MDAGEILSLHEEAERAVKSIKLPMIASAIRAEVALNGLASKVDFDKLQGLHDSIKQFAFPTLPAFENTRALLELTKVADVLTREHKTLADHFAEVSKVKFQIPSIQFELLNSPVIDAMKQFEKGVAYDLTFCSRMLELSTTTEAMMAKIKLPDLGKVWGLALETKTSLLHDYNLMTRSYEGLFKGVEPQLLTKALNRLPESFTRFPVIEYFNATDLSTFSSDEDEESELDEIRASRREEIKQETEEGLIALVTKHHPELLKMIYGGREARSSTNPDSLRHFSASYRELLTATLHLLAPDEAIKKWSKSPGDFHEGRPTRNARMRYIHRDLVPKAQELAESEDEVTACCMELLTRLEDFSHADIQSTSNCFQLLNVGTHKVSQIVTEKSKILLQIRVESLVYQLLAMATGSI